MLRSRLAALARVPATPMFPKPARNAAILGANLRFLSSSRPWSMQKNPKKVSTTSTTTPITTGVHAESRSTLSPPEPAGVTQLTKELKGIGQSLEGIPQPALLVGLAGTLPYLGTSVGSLYLSWNISKFHTDFDGSFSEKLVMLTPETAEQWLPILQTIQVGYGACILSFLGAIHWGFEMSRFGGEVGLKRYILGATPALIAWPSILLPVDMALIAHFITFTGVWFADSAAARQGFAPGWYNQYRFLLTFIVCSSILLTLIVSGWLGDPQQATPHSSRLESLREDEANQLEKDNAAVAAKTKAGRTTKEDKIKRQGDDQETMNEKEKETQEQDKAAGREKVAKADSGDTGNNDATKDDSKNNSSGESSGAAKDGSEDSGSQDFDEASSKENKNSKDATSDSKKPQDGKDVKQNPDKKGGKAGGTKEPVGSAANSDPDGENPVEAKKNSAGTDNKTTSKEDSDRLATEGKAAEKGGKQK